MFLFGLRRGARSAGCGLGLVIFVLGLWLLCGGAAAREMRLALEVTINGHDTNLIGQFVMDPDQRISVTRGELRELGVEPGAGEDDETIALDAITWLTYRYDAARQGLDLQVPIENLKTQELGQQQAAQSPALTAASDPGAVINYGLTVSYSNEDHPGDFWDWDWAWTDFVTLSVDTRVFGPYGTLVNTGVLGSGIGDQDSVLRLDTTWSWSDPHNVWTWSAGDLTTSSLAWTRPVRLGGLQWRTNFALRPDLVTTPQPQISGSAAVPSTVDVFINNTRAYSGDVKPGPFRVSQIPAVTGGGQARIVVKDAAGRESVKTTPFYVSPTLLRAGLFEHAIEVGAARHNYARFSNDYDDRLAGSASLRYGFSDQVTLEGHLEGTAGQANAGMGLVATVFDRAVLSLAADVSYGGGDSGLQLYGALETKVGPISVNLSSRRTFGSYWDLASVLPGDDVPFGALSPPRALDIVSFSTPVSELGGSLSLGFIHRESEEDSARLVSASYSRALFGANTLLISGFHDLEASSSLIFAGLSIPLGDLGHVHAGASADGSDVFATADYSKTASEEPGSVGWRVSVRHGATKQAAAAVIYQSSIARLEGGIEQAGSALRLRTYADGAVVFSARGPMLANRIDDSFAVVDVGYAGVPVMLENRPVAITNAQGLALVPGLRSYDRNRISIDPDRLPADVSVPEVQSTAVPADRGGTTVRLTSRTSSDAAIVIFQSPDGAFIELGSEGIVEGSGRTFVVGYDGRAYLEELAEHNQVTITSSSGACAARFAFAPHTGTGPRKLKAVCQ